MLIGLTQGDPSGIGPEILVKLLASLAKENKESKESKESEVTPVVFGARRVLERACETLGIPLNFREIDLARPEVSPGEVALVEVQLEKLPPLGAVNEAAGRHALAVLERAGHAVRDGRIQAIVTTPISKEAIQTFSPDFIGHTEYLAELAGRERFGMLLSVDDLKVLHVTTHQSLRSACEAIRKDAVLDTIRLMRQSLDYLGGEAGAIAVCALNPHAGENGKFGLEEIEEIEPAVRAAQKEGIPAIGPLPPDTVFYRAVQGEFKGIVAMYHDQGHIPLKMLGLDRGINITVGLPFIRTSVDHGTAFDKAGKGTADEGSLAAAYQLAVELAKRQAQRIFSTNERGR